MSKGVSCVQIPPRSHAPYLAAQFEEHSNKLMESYGDFFDRDGWTNMWGRSNIYRFAATSAFDGNMMLRHSSADPGVARRIASGSLLQFLSRDDFLFKGVPTLGFYGQFTPLVQGYSCAESPFWMGKAFLCLHLPEDHPFWTAKESLGSWASLKENEVKETVLDGPALAFTNHEANGETILRSGKVVKNPKDIHGMWNYAKLSFNTKYPWESTPVGSTAEGLVAEAQQYVLTDFTEAEPGTKEASEREQRANVCFWHGLQDGVLYRRQFFNYSLEKECHWIQAVNLADFPVPYGIFRVDKLRLYRAPIAVTLGSYGFPDNAAAEGGGSPVRDACRTQFKETLNEAKRFIHGTEVFYREKDGAKAIILKGHDHCGCEKQLAMTVFAGFDSLELVRSEGTNPDSERSIVIVATARKNKRYGYGPYLLISQVITKESHEDFTEDELFPVEKISLGDEELCGGGAAAPGNSLSGTAVRPEGGYGPVTVCLKDGTRKMIDFAGIEGKLML